MATELDDETKEEIVDTWESKTNPSYSEVADECDVHRDTVKKYVNKLESGEEDLPDGHDDVPTLRPDASDDPSLFPDPGENMANDFKDLLQRLSDEYGIGIKSKAIKMMAGEVRTSGQLPSPDDLANFLEQADSGITNKRELQWVTRQYRIWLENYQSKRVGAGGSSGFEDPTGMGFGGGGGYAPGNGQGQQSPSMLVGGGQQHPQQAQPGMNQGMMMMFQQMQQQLNQLAEKVEGSGSEQQSDTIERKAEEFLETKLEQLIDADTDDEQEAIVQEIKQLRRDIAEGGGRQPPELGDDWRANIVDLARAGEIEMSEAKDLLEEFGEVEANPEVMEKKYEKKMKEMELDHKKERQKQFGELFENLTDRLGESIGEAIVSGGEETGQADETATADGGNSSATTSGPTPDNPAEPEPRAVEPETEECPECGKETFLQDANAAVCTECEYGIAPCDSCGHPTEIPPIDEAEYRECGNCRTPLAVPDDPGETIECETCEWEGTADEMGKEYLKCDNCTELRPIMRQSEMQERAAAIQSSMNESSEVTDVLDEDLPDI